MKLEIVYLKKADKFFIKNSNILTKIKTKELLIKAVKKIVKKEDINIDVKRLQGNLHNFYRIRNGKIRILFELENNEIKIIAIINDIDFRGGIYKWYI